MLLCQVRGRKETKKMSVNNVDVERAHVLQTNDSYTYVDVRSAPEYEKGHPAGAHNVPLLQFDVASGQMQPNPDFLSVMQANYARDAKLLVGCQVGGRSAQAAQILASAGYTDVSNVQGGFGGARDPATGQFIHQGWVQVGLPVEAKATPKGSYAELKQTARQ